MSVNTPTFTLPAAGSRRWLPPALRLAPWCAVGALLALGIALPLGLAMHPSSAQQGDAWRMAFLHVPAAWMSLLLYFAMAALALRALIHGSSDAAILQQALAPTGVMFTLLGLWSGAAWSRSVAGLLVLDARLACELVLLVLYGCAIGLRRVIDERARADAACAVLVLVGALNLPIIYFSLDWWGQLHQASGTAFGSSPAATPAGLAEMLLVVLGFSLFAGALVLARARRLLEGTEASHGSFNAG